MRPLLLAIILSSAVCAQTAIEGDVTNSATGAPLAGTYVVLRMGPQPVVATTDSSGHFRAPLPLPHWGSIEVYRAGFLTLWPAFASPMRLALTPQAAITGKIVDEDGFPVENATIQALRFRAINGRRELQSAGGFAQANDLGEYRIAGLAAGRYYLRVEDLGGHLAAQYYPGTLDPREAGVVEVSAGEERGVDFRVVPLRGASVSGQVIVPSAGSPQPVSVGLRPLDSPRSVRFFGPTRADGTFSLLHVSPGTYVLRAGTNNPPRPGDLLAEQRVEVRSADISGIVLAPHPVEAVDLAGMVVFEGGAKPRPVVIGARTVYGSSFAARPSGDGSFVLKGLLPETYNVMWMPDRDQPADPDEAPVVLSSVRQGDKDLPVIWNGVEVEGGSAGPLRITFAPAIVLKGKLLDAAGSPAANAWVAFVPAQGSRSPANAPSGPDGTFTSSPTLPGEYRIYVVPDYAHRDLMEDPDYLKAHENDFPPLRVAAGANPPLTLRVPATQQ